MPLLLPPLPGPHPVGTVTFDWTDPSRPETLLPSSGTFRRVIAELHYPAARAGARKLPYVPERAAVIAWIASHGWGDDEAKRLTDLYGPAPTHSAPDLPPAAGEKAWPVILFSPGAYQSRHQYTWFGEILASYGYAVALLSHPFAGLDFFDGLGLIGRHAQWTAPLAASYKESDAFYEPMTDILAADARFVLDRITALAAAGNGLFAGRLDTGRAGIIGHSRGGKTAARAASTDARIKAALVYDNLPPAPERTDGFPQAVMFVNAVDPALPEHWRSTGRLARWTPGRLQQVRELVAANRAPAYEVTLTGIGHMNFCDRGIFEAARFPATVGAKAAVDRITAYSLAFLDRHLKDGPAAPLLFGQKQFAEADCFAGAAARAGMQ